MSAQRTIGDFAPAGEPEPESESALGDREQQWIAANVADAPSPRRCLNCGAHVTQRFARTLGSAQGRAWACGECATNEELDAGAAATPGWSE